MDDDERNVAGGESTGDYDVSLLDLSDLDELELDCSSQLVDLLADQAAERLVMAVGLDGVGTNTGNWTTDCSIENRNPPSWCAESTCCSWPSSNEQHVPSTSQLTLIDNSFSSCTEHHLDGATTHTTDNQRHLVTASVTNGSSISYLPSRLPPALYHQKSCHQLNSVCDVTNDVTYTSTVDEFDCFEQESGQIHRESSQRINVTRDVTFAAIASQLLCSEQELDRSQQEFGQGHQYQSCHRLSVASDVGNAPIHDEFDYSEQKSNPSQQRYDHGHQLIANDIPSTAPNHRSSINDQQPSTTDKFDCSDEKPGQSQQSEPVEQQDANTPNALTVQYSENNDNISDSSCQRQKCKDHVAGTATAATSTTKRAPSRRKLPCPTCHKLYRPFYLTVHLRTHTGEKPHACSEPDCRRQFSAACYLKLHVRRCHQRPLTATNNATEPSVATYICTTCQRPLASKSSLREHIRTVHPTEESTSHHHHPENFLCQWCGASFRQASLLASHVQRAHHEQNAGGDFTCERCGNRYKYKRSLERHIERFHEGVVESFACERCDRSFSTRSKLREHGVNVHDGNSPWICPICSKRLLAKKTLQNHLNIHGDVKPFECSFCARRFRFAVVLQRHLATHTLVKPFNCERCGKGFIHKVYRQRHMLKCLAAVAGSGDKSDNRVSELPESVSVDPVLPLPPPPSSYESVNHDLWPISMAVAGLGLADVICNSAESPLVSHEDDS